MLNTRSHNTLRKPPDGNGGHARACIVEYSTLSAETGTRQAVRLVLDSDVDGLMAAQLLSHQAFSGARTSTRPRAGWRQPLLVVNRTPTP